MGRGQDAASPLAAPSRRRPKPEPPSSGSSRAARSLHLLRDVLSAARAGTAPCWDVPVWVSPLEISVPGSKHRACLKLLNDAACGYHR